MPLHRNRQGLSRIIRTGMFWLALVLPSALYAAGESALWMPPTSPVPTPPKPVAVIYFNSGERHLLFTQRMIKQAKNQSILKIQDYLLTDETTLPDTVDKIAESDIGLIIIVAPRDRTTLVKIPSLYPDIRFTIIDLDPPEYFPNGHSLVYKDTEGLFMMGALAAAYSKTGIIEFISSEDTPHAHDLAYAFVQGATYSHNDIEVLRQFGGKNISDENADVAFLYGEEHLQTALRNAKQQKRTLILYDHDLTGEYPGIVLTSVVKRYDLAIAKAIQDYQSNHWKAGSQSLGIGNGYIDYTLSNNNRALLSEDMIELVERVKDMVSQGFIKIVPLDE
jgi:basic membrane protein A and related proteins